MKNLSNFRISTVQKDAKFLLEFKERYQIKIRFPIKHHHVKELTLQYYDLVSTNNNARLKIHAKDANCSIMEVDFERVHDTKNGFFYYIEFNFEKLKCFRLSSHIKESCVNFEIQSIFPFS